MAEKEPIQLDVNSFPSNSHASKERYSTPSESEAPKKIEKMVTGKVVKRKKPITKRFVEVFFGEDIDNVREYVLYDVFIPKVKDTVFDIFSQGVEMLLFGEANGRRHSNSNVRRDGNKSYVSYSAYYSDKSGRNTARVNRSTRPRHNFDDLIFETRVEAEDVLNSLADLVIDYEQATVADLYDACGIETVFTDNKYGWMDLRSASVGRCREGYILNLPKPRPLD